MASVYQFEDCELDLGRHELRRSGEPVSIEPQVFDVLTLLTTNYDRMLTKSEILDTVWGDQFVSESALSSRIKSARQAVGDNGRDQRIIRTVHGRGFRFVADVSESDPGQAGTEPSKSPDQPAPAENSETETVSFLFSDIEGSTRLWQRHGEDMRAALSRHDQILRSHIVDAGGTVFKHTGDGVAATFADTDALLGAAVAVQAELQAVDWAPLDALPVRMAVHRGDATSTAGDFFGHTVSAAGKLLSVANGHQIVASDEAVRSVTSPDTMTWISPAGAYSLPDLGDHVPLFVASGPGMTVDSRPLRASIGARTNLRRPRDLVLGRSDEMARALEHVDQSDVVSIVGPGGAGKTTVALALGQELLATQPGGVWFCELASVTSEQVAATVLDSLTQNAGSGIVSAEQIIDRIGHEPTVLILDNCEQVIDAAAKLTEELVVLAPELTVLVTSREALDIRGERLLRIEGLARGSVNSAAVELFLRRAREVTTLDDDDETRQLVDEITQRLEGLPLAIELAAPQLASLTLRELLDALEDQLSLLRSRRRYESRQAAMDDAISWSVDLLTDHERATLFELSAFAGAFTAAAAGAICSTDSVQQMLHRLVAQSVIVRLEADRVSRYRLLEPIRQFAAQNIDPAQGVAAHERHARYFADRVTSLAADMRGPNEPQAAEALTAEWHDFGKSLAWGREHQDPDVAFAPLIALEFHLLWQLRIEGFMWLELAAEAMDDLGPRRSAVEFMCAIGAWATNDQERSDALLTSAVEADGWTTARAFLKFYQGFARNDAEALLEAGDLAWEESKTDDDETWIIAAAAFKLISRSMHNPIGPEIEPLAAVLDQQIELNEWPTGLCMGLLSHLTRSVMAGSIDEAQQFADSLTRVAAEAHVPWYPMTGGPLMANLQATADPIAQLEATTATLRTALSAGEIVQMPAFLRTVFVALESTGQLEPAAILLGLIPSIRGLGEDGAFSPGYEDAVARINAHFEQKDLDRFLAAGRLMTLEDAADLGEQALESLRHESAGTS